MNSHGEVNREIKTVFLEHGFDELSQYPARRSLLRFAMMFRHAKVGMIRVTSDNLIQAANSAFAAMLGCSAAELVGHSYLDLLASGEMEAAAQDWKSVAMDSRRSQTSERRFRHRHGQIVYTRETLTRVDEHSHLAQFIAIYQDVSESKSALEEQSAREHELRLVLESAARLAESVAFDLSNYLMIIASYAELIEGHTEDSRILKSTAEINAAARRATGLTERLLTFSRQELKNPGVLRS